MPAREPKVPAYALEEGRSYDVSGIHTSVKSAEYTGYEMIGHLVLYCFQKGDRLYKFSEVAVQQGGGVRDRRGSLPHRHRCNEEARQSQGKVGSISTADPLAWAGKRKTKAVRRTGSLLYGERLALGAFLYLSSARASHTSYGTLSRNRRIKLWQSNEKYKGDALLQKVYTVDFLSKKKKVNEGEVPQYYVENNHDAIIDPAVFEAVQKQMAVRQTGTNRQSSVGIFSSKIKCGDCGSWYGSKVWHSNDKYRRIIWQCNHKFDGGEKCSTPHLDEETIKGLFIKAVNILTTEKDEIAANFQAIKGQLFSTGELETEQSQLQEELNVVAELIQQCVRENAHVAINQTEYQARYDGLAERFDRTKARLDEVGNAITEKQAKKEQIERFLAELERQDGAATEFDEEQWYSLVDFVTVFNERRYPFHL